MARILQRKHTKLNLTLLIYRVPTTLLGIYNITITESMLPKFSVPK